MEFFYGVAGALVVLALLGFGFFMGWMAHKSSRIVTAEKLNEQERRRMKQEQEAFNLLQNYTVERAYGIGGVEPKEE